MASATTSASHSTAKSTLSQIHSNPAQMTSSPALVGHIALVTPSRSTDEPARPR